MEDILVIVSLFAPAAWFAVGCIAGDIMNRVFLRDEPSE